MSRRRVFDRNSIPNSWKSGFNLAKNAMLHGDSNDKNVFSIGAALFSGSNPLSIGYNIYEKTHPYFVDFDNQGDEFCRNTHAELMALTKRKHLDNNNLILYVYRETKNGVPVNSEPCKFCKKIIKEFDVEKVRFTTAEGKFVEERPRYW